MRLPLRRVMLAALLVPALAACSSTSDREDCQSLMSRRKYAEVLKRCDSPYERASARLGLMGFDVYQLLTLDPAAPVVITVLGLTPTNIDSKRVQVNAAVNEVRPPATSAEAYAALLAGFLALNTTLTQFLDNCPAADCPADTPLDNVISSAEVEEATGMTTGGTPDFSAAQSGVFGHYSVVVGGQPYIVVCFDLALPACDGQLGETVDIYDDVDGSGMFDPGSPPPVSASPPDLSMASTANLVLHLTNLVLPVNLDPVKTPQMQEFLGQGNPAGTFDIGTLAYLDLMEQADQVIIDAAGGTVAETPISDYIAQVRALLDNGGDCVDTLDPSMITSTFLDTLAPIQTAAAGTAQNPVPFAPGSEPAGYYQAYNAPASLDLSGFGLPLPVLNPADYVWAGSVTVMRYKLLYPKVQGPGGPYDFANATPRVDEADAAFVSALDALPELSPALAGPGDGRVNFIELLCVGN